MSNSSGGKAKRSVPNASARTKQGRALPAKVTPARTVAYQALWLVETEGSYISHALERVCAKATLSVEDAAFARLLATEVVARCGSLDALINKVLSSPSDVQQKVRVALRISFCELFYLRKPAHVAVSQGVELVRSIEPKASRLANFALRRGAELVGSFPFSNPSQSSAAAALEQGFPEWLANRLAGEYSRAQAYAFMQHSNEPAPLFFMLNAACVSVSGALAALHSQGISVARIDPPVMDSVMTDAVVTADAAAGADADADTAAATDADTPNIAGAFEAATMLNSGVPSGVLEADKKTAKALKFSGVLGSAYSMAPSFPFFLFAQRKAIGNQLVAKLLAEGGLVVSDAAAMTVASLTVPSTKPNAVLEIGAGRGTKSILLQNAALVRFGQQVALDTVDVNPASTQERTRRLRRARIVQRASYTCDATKLMVSPLASKIGSYDAVFVDAPCSGVGTLRRHADIRWRLHEAAITQLAQMGMALLEQAAAFVAPGGQLTYATCTVFAEENIQVVTAFLASSAGANFTLVYAGTTAALFEPLPAQTPVAPKPLPDVHFVAIFIRS